MSVELFTIALMPEGPAAAEIGIDANDLRKLAVHARSIGLRIEGIRIAVSDSHNNGPPLECKVRRLLKYALRAADLRCRDIKQVKWEKALENPRAGCATTPDGHNKGQFNGSIGQDAGPGRLRAAG